MSILHELEEAKRAKEAADRRVEELLGRAKEEGLEQIRTIVKELGLTANDLSKLVSGPTKTRQTRKAAAFWYRNPVDASKVWKGAGPKPAWLKELSNEAQEACKVTVG
ncbi:MAG: H-NS histone family protein [Acidithiobacillus sp.]